jgi:hypothetical protein
VIVSLLCARVWRAASDVDIVAAPLAGQVSAVLGSGWHAEANAMREAIRGPRLLSLPASGGFHAVELQRARVRVGESSLANAPPSAII